MSPIKLNNVRYALKRFSLQAQMIIRISNGFVMRECYVKQRQVSSAGRIQQFRHVYNKSLNIWPNV